MSLIRDLATKFGVKPEVPTIKEGTQPSKPVANVVPHQAQRVGLLATQELDNAIARCKAKVESIARECRNRNRRFRDIEFDLESNQDHCLHGLYTSASDKKYPADVLRVPQIFENPQFIVDGVESSDIEQGALGDCWFMSAIATLSTIPGLIDKICVAQDEKVGIYGFIFVRDGEWEDVIIDDQLFTTAPRWETLAFQTQNLYHLDKDMYNNLARKGGKTLFFGRSKQENETWVPLLEKAYAKFHGDYASLIGGYGSQALEDLTGGVSQIIYPKDIFDKDRFWHEDLMLAAKDRLFGCYTDSIAGKGVATNDTKIHGLIGGHAYSILAAMEYKGKRFLKIRNPWGDSEWTGRWSDGSKEWTAEWRDALGVLGHEFGDDGAFIMEYEDFLQTWFAIERTQIFDSSWIRSTYWLNVTSRCLPSAWQFGDVSFMFSLPKASPAIIILAQSDTRFYGHSGNSNWMFDFVLYKKGSEDIIGRSEFSLLCSRSANLSLDLDAGEYILHVRLGQFNSTSDDSASKPEEAPKLDARKLAKVLSQKAKSMSIAANFDPREFASNLVVAPETFAGRTLTQLEVENFKAAIQEQKELRDKFNPPPPQVINVTFPDKEQGEDKKGDDKTQIAETAKADSQGAASSEQSTSTETSGTVKGDSAGETRTADDSGAEKPSDSNPDPPTPKTDSETKTSATTESKPELSQPDGPVHDGIICDGCRKTLAGVRWKCLECSDYDLCDKCHASGVQSQKHFVRHRMLRKDSPEETISDHAGIVCDGCKTDPLRGVRWKCLVCNDFDLCDACHASGAHPVEHEMLRCVTPADAENLKEENSTENVLLGLRVYTKKDVPVNISGQLRHGKLVSWKKQISEAPKSE